MLQIIHGALGTNMNIINAQTSISSWNNWRSSKFFLADKCHWQGWPNYYPSRKPISFSGLFCKSFPRRTGGVRRLGLARSVSHERESATVEPNDDVQNSSSVEHNEDLAEETSGRWQWNKSVEELVAYGLLIAAVPIVPSLPRFEWSGAFYFLFLAVWSVYVGSHRSLGKKPSRKMSLNQGLAVPIFCSASLFGFYCLLRFFPNLDLRTFITAYLGVAGAAAVASNLSDPLRRIIPTYNSTSWKIRLPKWLLEDEDSLEEVNVAAADIIAIVVGVGASVASYQADAPYTLKNLIAVCIVTELLQLLSLGSFVTAAAMLGGLLLYDVFWVFGSSHVFGDNVMVTVATSTAFDGPMKLIFPQFKENAAGPYSILGLGDIAAPGLLIALMLRFDKSRVKHVEPNPNDGDLQSTEVNAPLDKTYFVTCLASYILGLTLTVVANTVSGAAQPALLYLVPSLLSGVFLTAVLRSETPLLLDYKDEAAQ